MLPILHRLRGQRGARWDSPLALGPPQNNLGPIYQKRLTRRSTWTTRMRDNARAGPLVNLFRQARHTGMVGNV